MRFTVTGKFVEEGQPFSITWNNGRLEGDPNIVAAFEWLASRRDGEALGAPTGPFTTNAEDHISNPISFAFLVNSIVDDPQYSGDVPRLPPLPDGAIA